MAYGLKYQGEYSNTENILCRLEIYQKDYAGINYSLRGLKCVQNWNADEIKPAIKACSLEIYYDNYGSQPLLNFVANTDDEYLVKFYFDGNLVFTGYLVYDEMAELMVDYTHEVRLTASDNLGLLRDVRLDLTGEVTTVPCMAQGDVILITSPQQNWINLINIGFTPVVGTPFTISGHSNSSMNGTFTPTQVTQLSPTNFRVRTNTVTGDTVVDNCVINGTRSIPIPNKRVTLANILHASLIKTGLELDTYVYANIFEDNHGVDTSFLHQTYIDPETFISGEEYDNCYSVLEKILSKFHLTLFQAYGRWNLIRWDELRQGLPNAFVYDKDFAFVGNDILDANWLVGFQQDTFPEFGLTKQPVRPFEYVKETFNYQNPRELLKNYDLKKLGALQADYILNGNRVREYDVVDWTEFTNTGGFVTSIRVTEDQYGKELSRYLVERGFIVPFNPIAGARSLVCQPIEITEGDLVLFSCSTRGINFFLVTGTLDYVVELTNGSQTVRVDNNGNWGANYYTFTIPTNPNMQQWTDITINSKRAPFSGFLRIYLHHYVVPTLGIETHYRDLRLEIKYELNQSKKIIGHIHNDKQSVIIKNNESQEIQIDDSPRNTISGTLFTSMFNGVTQDRTARWYRDGITEDKSLGQIITQEQLQWRSVPRTKLEGNFLGINQSGCISPLVWFKYNELPGLNFVFGSLEIDYLNNQCRATAWELFKDGEPDVVDDYSFTYIYDTK